MIHIPAFSLTGTADFSSIRTELQNLEKTIGSLRVPRIKTDVETPNFSNFFSAIDQAEKKSVIKIKPEVDNSFMGGLSKFASSETGKFSNVGKELGQNLTMGMQQQFGMIGGMAATAAQALGPIGIAAGVAGAGIIALGAASVGAAKEWQSLMTNVGKTTGLDASGLAALSGYLTDISTKSPIAASELANIASVAGSLGVGDKLAGADKAKAIADFSEVASQMAVAFELPAEEAATSGAKILTAFNQPINTQNMTALGNIVNTMGDNYAATESQVLDFTNRASYLNTTFGMTIPQVAAWGTTLISSGMEAETASTGIKSLMNMSMDPKKFDEFAKAAGMSGEELKKSLNEDVMGTYSMVADKISSGTDAVEKFQTVSKLAGTEGMTTLMKMAGKGDVLQTATSQAEEQQALAASGTGGSMAKTFEAQSATVDAQITLMSNSIGAILRDIGGPMLAPIATGIGMVTSGLNVARGAGEAVFGAITGSSAFQQLTNIGSTISGTIGSVAGSIGDIFSTIGGSLNSALGGNALGTLFEAMTTPLSISLGIINQMVGLIGSGVVTGWSTVASIVETVASALEITSAYIQAFAEVTGISGAFESVRSAIDDIISKVKDIGSKISSGVTSAIPKVLNSLSEMAKNFGKLVADAIVGPLSEIAGAVGLGDVVNNLGKISARATSILETPKAAAIDVTAAEMTDTTSGTMNTAGNMAGTVYGDALGSALKTKIPKAVSDGYLASSGLGSKAGKDAGDTFGDGFLKALKDNKVSSQIGTLIYDAAGNIQMSDAAALAAINSQARTSTNTRGYDESLYSFMDKYTLQNRYAAGGETGTLTILDASGKAFDVKEYIQEGAKVEGNFDEVEKAMKNAIKPTFLDMPKWMKSVSGDLKAQIKDITSDFKIAPDEKAALKSMLDMLDDLRVQAPIEFDSSGLLKIRDEAEKTFLGIPITFNKEELETNFALWQRDNMDMYQTIYDTLSPKYGKFAPQAVPTESEERKLHDILVSADNERLSYLYDQIDQALKSGNFEDAEVLPEVFAEIATIEPDLLKLPSTIQRVDAIQEKYGDRVLANGETFRVLDENGNTLASSHLRTSVAGDLTSTGLLKVMDASYKAATALERVGGIQFSGPASDWDNYNWVQSRVYDTEKNTAFAGTYQGTFNTGTNKTLNFGSVASISDFGGLLSDFDIPKLGQVSKVSAQTGGTLAILAERGEDELVIPVSSLKGLWPESAKIDKSSFSYLSNYKYFNDYQEPEIRPSTAYRWSHYPDAPQVQEFNTEAIQTAWLADNQLNTKDIYSGLVRQAQIDAIGKQSVIPWFARGMQDQPGWWTEAATKLSPQYASNWAAQKGGVVPQIVDDTTSVAKSNVKPNSLLTGSTAWATIYDDSGTCIGFNKPDPSANIKLTPRAVSFDAEAFAGVYDDSGTCIAFVKPDKNLNFKPGPGYEVGGSRVSGSITSTEVSKTLDSIDKNTAESAKKLDESTKYSSQLLSSINEPIKGFDPGNAMKTLSISSMPGGALVTGLSKEGYLATYDPRTDTCEGLSFNPPDPSLKTTDKFYLGITSGNLPNESYDEGYGWGGKVAWTDNPELAKIQQGVMQSYKEQQKTAKDTEKIEQNTKDMATGLGTMTSGNISGGILGALVALYGVGGGSGALNSRGTFGGSYGSLFGNWYGGGASGLSAHLGTGSSASWMNAAATSIGGSGAIQWAEGGITDRPTYGVFGEAGREAFVPISDRAAGLRILPQVMRELGVRTFAQGGIVGGFSAIMESIGSTTIAPVYHINGSGLSESQLLSVMERNNKKILAQVAKKDVLARKRRG